MTATTSRATSACVVAYLMLGLLAAPNGFCAAQAATPAVSFEWRSTETSDLLLWSTNGDDTRPLLELVRPVYSTSDIEGTKKPFHHLFSPADGRRLTKGADGLYPHHRGLFYGYNQIEIKSEGDSEEVQKREAGSTGETTIDIWHARNGEHTQYRRTVEKSDSEDAAGHTVVIDWLDRQARVFASEQRSVRVSEVTAASFLVDIETLLSTQHPSVVLGGDRQHAGVQFRAAQAVAEAKETTRFQRPSPWHGSASDSEVNDDSHIDLPWNAMIFELDGQSYTVVYMSSPDNPSPAYFSERSYGRFGEFVPHELTPTSPLHLRYRLWIAVGRVETSEIEQRYERFRQQDF